MAFLNEYTKLGELGKGGFATVFKVRHNELGYLRAIRVLNQPVADEQSKVYQNFLRECKVLLRLGNGSQRSIIHIYQPRLLEGHALVEMDYVDGTDLTHYLKENGNFLQIDEVLRMVREISDALAYCHEDIYKFCIDPDEDQLDPDPVDGSKWLIDKSTKERLINKYKVIHNDIHSGNIMRRGDGSFVLLDFGLAIEGDEVVKTSSRHENGAPEYMSPEKWEDESALSEQSDIYSFGVVMYEYLAGRVPYVCENNSFSARKNLYENIRNSSGLPSIADIRGAFYENKYKDRKYEKDYPDWLEEAIAKCLERDPSKRFRNGRQLKKFITEHIKEDNLAKEKSISHLKKVKKTLNQRVRALEDQVRALGGEPGDSPVPSEAARETDAVNNATAAELERVKAELKQLQEKIQLEQIAGIGDNSQQNATIDRLNEELADMASGKKKLALGLTILSCFLAVLLAIGSVLYINGTLNKLLPVSGSSQTGGSYSDSYVSELFEEISRLAGLVKQKDREIASMNNTIESMQYNDNSSYDEDEIKDLSSRLNSANSTIESLKQRLNEVVKERDILREML